MPSESQIEGGNILSLEQVVETSLYADDLEAMERFYATVLMRPVIGKEDGRHVFFSVGERSVLLVFNPATTMSGHHLPHHGSRGPGHVALGIRASQLDAWRQRLQTFGVDVEKELEWPRGGKSIYFRDPAGNSIELITPGVWGTAAGW